MYICWYGCSGVWRRIASFDIATGNCTLTLVDKVKALLKLLDNVQPCCGNSDNRFYIHKGIMLDKLSKHTIVYSNLFVIIMYMYIQLL